MITAWPHFADVLKKDRIVADAAFSRWRLPPTSIAVHLCVGLVSAKV